MIVWIFIVKEGRREGRKEETTEEKKEERIERSKEGRRGRKERRKEGREGGLRIKAIIKLQHTASIIWVTIQHYVFLISKHSEVYKLKNGSVRVAIEP